MNFIYSPYFSFNIFFKENGMKIIESSYKSGSFSIEINLSWLIVLNTKNSIPISTFYSTYFLFPFLSNSFLAMCFIKNITHLFETWYFKSFKSFRSSSNNFNSFKCSLDFYSSSYKSRSKYLASKMNSLLSITAVLWVKNIPFFLLFK